MVAIRDALRGDVKGIVAIERDSFSDPWTAGMFTTHLSGECSDTFLVAEDGAVVVGYAIARTVGEESELMNIAVDPAHRACGIGAALLDATVHRCRAAGAAEMWLEVRASNAGARTLYDSRGFSAVGVRKRYYHAPREDAIVLRADLVSAARNDTVTRADVSLSAEPVDSILSPASHFTRQETK
jgi:[ribosomal protein S18]-alanine N-acetyltransferase